jgi:hypothetical protein
MAGVASYTHFNIRQMSMTNVTTNNVINHEASLVYQSHAQNESYIQDARSEFLHSQSPIVTLTGYAVYNIFEFRYQCMVSLNFD